MSQSTKEHIADYFGVDVSSSGASYVFWVPVATVAITRCQGYRRNTTYWLWVVTTAHDERAGRNSGHIDDAMADAEEAIIDMAYDSCGDRKQREKDQ